MKKLLKNIDYGLARVADMLLAAYQATLSPDKGLLSPWLRGTVCAHEPHCSQYARECLDHYDLLKSMPMITERILSCGPSSMSSYDPSKYRIVFASGAPIGKVFLSQLMEDPRYEVCGVLTMPAAASWRGMKIRNNIIATHAESLGIDTAQIQTPHSLRLHSKKRWDEAKEATDWLEALKPDFLVVVAYGLILPESTLSIPYFGPINVHGSLLPKYRGASPLQSVFLSWESETGVTVMHMDAWVDTGDMINTLATPLAPQWTVKDLIQWIEAKAPRFLCHTLREFAKWRLDRQPQDYEMATHTQKMSKSDGLISMQDSLSGVNAKYRAYALWPKIHFSYNAATFTVESLSIDSLDDATMGQPWCDPETLKLHPAILNCTVKPSGKKVMWWDDFINWYGT